MMSDGEEASGTVTACTGRAPTSPDVMVATTRSVRAALIFGLLGEAGDPSSTLRVAIRRKRYRFRCGKGPPPVDYRGL
jgi:hypothetical protein